MSPNYLGVKGVRSNMFYLAPIFAATFKANHVKYKENRESYSILNSQYETKLKNCLIKKMNLSFVEKA